MEQPSADTVIAEFSAREMWDLVANNDRQYLLIGDGEHPDTSIKRRLAPALSLLAFDNFAHLALEWPESSMQPVIDAYGRAIRRAGGQAEAVVNLFNDLSHNVPRPLLKTEAEQTDRIEVDAAIIYGAHRHNIRLTALNPDLPPMEYYMAGERPDVRARMLQEHRHIYLHGRASGLLSPGETQRLHTYSQQHLDHNHGLDRVRAEKFVQLTGARRGGVMFGAGHFRGPGERGIDDFLPQDDITYVLMGNSFRVQAILEKQHGQPTRTPDFVFVTDIGRVYATPQALRNGLLP